MVDIAAPPHSALNVLSVCSSVCVFRTDTTLVLRLIVVDSSSLRGLTGLVTATAISKNFSFLKEFKFRMLQFKLIIPMYKKFFFQ